MIAEPLTRTVNSAAMMKLEREVVRIRRAGRVSPDPGYELAHLIEPILELGLPAAARVVLLNERPVRTLRGGFEVIQQRLLQNTAVSLNVEGAFGAAERRIYLLPGFEGAQ